MAAAVSSSESVRPVSSKTEPGVGQTGLGEPSGGLPQIDPHARHHGQPALPVRPTLT